MKEKVNLSFQKLDFAGLKTLVEWAEKEGWNPGLYDAEVFWQTDPEGFIGVFQDNSMIAGGAIVSYRGEYGFMGLFIVKPEFRSAGTGRKLWYHRRDALTERLDSGAAIGMDGVIAMQPFYNKGGFEIAFVDKRYGRNGAPFKLSTQIERISQDDFAEILDYDKLCFGFPRIEFLKPWLFLPTHKSWKYTENGIIKGFAVMRKAASGYKIGPLFADDGDIAEELYKACLNEACDEEVFLDIPMNNIKAAALMKKYGATYVFECARMYRGQVPKTEIAKVFGITTFELG
jgi:GNAT superfamily N-acetyltransferase